MPIDDCARGLPIRDALPAVRAALREHSNLVLAGSATLWLVHRLAGIDRPQDAALAGSLDALFSREARQKLDRGAPPVARRSGGRAAKP